jgi:hypothetical protein
MRNLFKILACTLFLNIACGLPIPPPNPNPQPPPSCSTDPSLCPDPQRTIATIVLDNSSNQPVVGAVCDILNNKPPSPIAGVTSDTGYVAWNGVFASVRQTNISCTAEGYNDLSLPVTIPVETNYQFPPIYMVPVVPPIPPPPTRDQALRFNMTAQGLMVHTSQFGDLHWWDAALSWLNAQDRQAVYAAKHAAGDTHVIIELPDGLPLYDECCNDYSPDRFPALDWSQGETSYRNSPLADLVAEVRRAGLIPAIFPDERYEHSLTNTLLAIDALQHSKYGDLTPQIAFFSTGWDGVFYGWPDSVSNPVISDWAVSVRNVCPACRLGIEFNSGHIPLGEGGGDYQPGGRMNGFDIILAEYDSTLSNDNFWQITGRMVPDWVSPPDKPAGDDTQIGTGPNRQWPPFYLLPQSPRGPYYYSCFEWRMYDWVRGNATSQDIANQRQYARNAGCYITG